MSIHSAITAHSREGLQTLRMNMEALPGSDAPGFGDMFDRFGDARIVLLGEATHGTHEFYAARAQITRRLIEHHGFNVVAVEGDWPDIARFDDYVRHGAPRPKSGDTRVRFPTWMWRNEDVRMFADWLRHHNAALPEAERTAMHGLDIYSLGESIDAVVDYLDARAPAAAAEARRRYGCLTPWQDEPQVYGRAVTQGVLAPCETAVVTQLGDLFQRRMALVGDTSGGDGEAYFDAEQNARIVRAAELYYRAMYRGAAESWNLRDRHMFDTLQALMAHRKEARAVIWAHNSHVGNAAATAMGWGGEFNIGELVRKAYGDRCVLIGFGTDRGTVAAAPFMTQVLVLCGVAIAMTVGVYGFVAGIVKIDDAGLHLSGSSSGARGDRAVAGGELHAYMQAPERDVLAELEPSSLAGVEGVRSEGATEMAEGSAVHGLGRRGQGVVQHGRIVFEEREMAPAAAGLRQEEEEGEGASWVMLRYFDSFYLAADGDG